MNEKNTIYFTFNVYVNVIRETIFMKCSVIGEHLLSYEIINSLQNEGFEYIPLDGFVGKEYFLPVDNRIQSQINDEINLFINTLLKFPNLDFKFENHVKWDSNWDD